MSSQDPIIITDTESEPEEASYESSDDTASRSTSKRPRDSPTSSDEVRGPIDTHDSLPVTPEPLPVTPEPTPAIQEPVSTVAPETIPTTTADPPLRPTFEVGGPSRPTKIRKTARKTVGRFPRRPLAPRDDSSDDTIDIPCDVERPRLPGPEPLPWMTSILPRWREIEGLPTTYALHAPITGEAIELTVPTLVAVCRTILQILVLRHAEIAELQHDTAHLEQDMLGVYGRFDLVEAQQEEIAVAADDRMEALEARQRVTSLALGVMVGLYLVSLIAGSFLPFWY